MHRFPKSRDNMSIGTFLKKKIISSFDNWSTTYSDDVAPKLQKRGYSYDQLAMRIIDYLNPPRGAHLAEVGVGTGILGDAVRQCRPDVTIIGFDISDRMLRHARHSAAYADLFQCDAEAIPVLSGSFGYTYSSFMLHSAPNVYDCLLELKRINKEDSKIAIVDLFRSKARVPVLSFIRDNLHSFYHEFGAPSNYKTVNELITAIDRTGLTVAASDSLAISSNANWKMAPKMMHHFLGLNT